MSGEAIELRAEVLRLEADCDRLREESKEAAEHIAISQALCARWQAVCSIPPTALTKDEDYERLALNRILTRLALGRILTSVIVKQLVQEETVHWQHEETGRICELPKGESPGSGWFEIPQEEDQPDA